MSRGHALVVRPDNNGDVLLAGPAIRAVAADADEVTLWVGPRGRHAAPLLPDVDRIFCHELPWIDLAPDPVDRAWLDDTIDAVAAMHLDVAIILTSFHQNPLPTALMLRAAGVPFVAATSVDYPGSLLDVRHRISDDLHEVERSLDLVASAGFRLPAGDDGRLRIRPPRAANPVPPGSAYVVVHPGSTAPARTWPPERHAQAVRLLAQAGWRVVITGGPDERQLTAEVAAKAEDAGAGNGGARGRVVDLGGQTDWETLARVIADAAALMVGNTGPAHLAAAVDTPVVELYAPVLPAVRWRPWQVPHVLLGSQQIACAGCRAKVCPVPGHPCLGTVDPAEVVTAVAALTRPAVTSVGTGGEA